LTLIFAATLGYGATVAEPALNAMGVTVENLTDGAFPKRLLIQTVAVGVALGIALGVAKDRLRSGQCCRCCWAAMGWPCVATACCRAMSTWH
jgi:hypothetical protein